MEQWGGAKLVLGVATYRGILEEDAGRAGERRDKQGQQTSDLGQPGNPAPTTSHQRLM